MLLSLFFGLLAVRSALASDDLSAEDEVVADDDVDDVDEDEEEPFLTALRCSGILVCLCFLGGGAVAGSVMVNEWTDMRERSKEGGRCDIQSSCCCYCLVRVE